MRQNGPGTEEGNLEGGLPRNTEALPLESDRWKEWRGIHGDAASVVRALARLRDEGPSAELEETLASNLLHQGTVATAAAPAVPHLVEAAGRMAPRERVMWLLLLAGIAEALAGPAAPTVPEDLRGALEAALHRAKHLLAETLFAAPWGEDVALHLLSAVAVLLGHARYREGILAVDEGVECPECGATVYPGR